jgi:CheY-like chemotaxis protein
MVDSPPLAPRILIVDDDRDFADAVVHIVEGEGFEASVAYSAESGVRLAAQFAFDIALVDLSLDTSSGLALPERLRRAAAGRPVACIAMSGHAGAAAKARAFAAGFSAYLTKPVSHENLMGTLQRSRP